MRRLVLFRHAKSDRPDGVEDHERPLAPRGRVAAGAMGEWMAEKGIIPDLVICSTSVRTRQTWDLAKPAFDPEPETIYEERIYEARPDDLLEVIREASSEVQTLMLVGHNPGMEILTGMLAESGEPAVVERFEKKFPTAAVAVLDFEDEPWAAIEEKTAWLTTFVTPKFLGIHEE